MSNSVTILDYGIGNILSVARGFEAIGADVNIKSNIEGIKNADRLILPGVGAFASGIEQLKVNNFDSAIIDLVNTGKPLLGICLGMQLLFTKSSEDKITNGLNLLSGDCKKFESGSKKTLTPHMGFNLDKMVSRWDKIETYKVLRELKATHMIDEDTYSLMLNALGIAQRESSILLYEGDQTINITLV